MPRTRIVYSFYGKRVENVGSLNSAGASQAYSLVAKPSLVAYRSESGGHWAARPAVSRLWKMAGWAGLRFATVESRC